jgi:hypothetical protein
VKTIVFSEHNRSGNRLHIELPGCIVNVVVGLTDRLGRQVTRVSISADDETRSPDENGYYWRDAGDGRVIRDLSPGVHAADALVRRCRFCRADIEQGADGLWADQSDAWARPPRDDGRDEIDRLACPQAPPRGSLWPGLHDPERDA